MGIQMMGIDHTAAGIDIRMNFSFTKKNTAEALEQIRQIPGVQGFILISTCNRMELWVSTGSGFQGSVFETLCEIKEVDPEQYRTYFFFRQEREAVSHLFRLASGLESRILGEDQIITQVKDALILARENYATDNVLETLFRQAVTVAKKVKTTVALSSSDQSVVRTAIETLKRAGMEFQGKTCMVIGNGVMGKLAANLLRQEGADVTVTVRQYRSGIVEIPRGCQRIDYGRRMELFGDCDYVVSATVSPNCTVTKEQAELYKKKPMVMIDLAVPRDIDVGVKDIEGIQLFDIDCFREEACSEEQKRAIAQAEQCFQDQMEEFFDWYEFRDVMPRIQVLKEQAARDLELRLQKKLRELSLSPEDTENLRKDIGAAAEKSVNKMIFGLKDSVSQHTFREFLDGLEKVYEE